MNIKKNITLIVGLAIPVLMIVLVAAVIYLPRLFYHPEFDFLYASDVDYYSKEQYVVNGGRLTKQKVERPDGYGPAKEGKLNVYDVSTDESREISFEEAEDLHLDSSGISPDGFEIVSGSGGRGGFFPFDYSSDDYCARYISGHNVSRKLNLRPEGSSYCGGFEFLGWIEEE